MPITPAEAIAKLKTFLAGSGTTQTRFEAHKFLDEVNGTFDGNLDNAKIDEFITAAKTGLATADPGEKAKLEAALKLLENVNEVRKKKPPPFLKKVNVGGKEVDLSDSPSIKEPYVWKDQPLYTRWKKEMQSQAGRAFDVSDHVLSGITNNALNYGRQKLGPGTSDAKALVHGLWENADSMESNPARVFRVQEAEAVRQLIKQIERDHGAPAAEAFKKDFFKEMANYIVAEFKDPKAILTSGLAALQATPEASAELRSFFKEMIIGIAQEIPEIKGEIDALAKESSAIISAYDDTDLNLFGSLALAVYKDKDGKTFFEFIEYTTTPDEANKVRSFKPVDSQNSLKKIKDGLTAETAKKTGAAAGETKLTDDEKKKIKTELLEKDIEIPKLLLSRDVNGLNELKQKLTTIKDIPNLPEDIKKEIAGLLKELEALIKELERPLVPPNRMLRPPMPPGARI